MAREALSLRRLSEKFASLPGIGYKTAWKLAFHIISLSEKEAKDFANAILEAHQKIHHCKVCQNLTDMDVCDICDDLSRDKGLICVVESPKDVVTFERSGRYNGLYHVIHGLISPMDGLGPNELKIKELLNRVNDNKINEVIMATNPTIEGEATAMYISKLLKPLGVKVSRLAYGIPVGAELEYADEMTISKALENRNEI